ncbi:MAG TPA: hypothetical protein VJJ79_02940 [Candidatus Nanoarchaeia archaeon]|nr:hypothetical protein [Candidatus Nanoarchaeia archaeon]
MSLLYRREKEYLVKGKVLIDTYRHAVLNCAYAEIARAECNALLYEIAGELLKKKVALKTIDNRKLLGALREDLEENKINLEHFMQQLNDINEGKLCQLAIPRSGGYDINGAIEMLDSVLKK